jgi:hypothetical protein
MNKRDELRKMEEKRRERYLASLAVLSKTMQKWRN